MPFNRPATHLGFYLLSRQMDYFLLPTRMLRLLTLSTFLFVAACTSSEREAESLLQQMQKAYKEGAAITTPDTRAAREQQLSSFEHVLSLSQRLEKKFPQTLVAQGVSAGQVDLGGVSLRQLRETIIPKLRRDLLAGSDPLTAARVLADRVTDPAAATQLLVSLARSFDSSSRSREAEAALADAFALTSSITDRTVRVERLSAIAFGHASASRRSQALDAAFSALSEAKQVTDIERRTQTLTEIALSYYILGVEERGYEALLSIPNKNTRKESLDSISRELLQKNLPHQVVAASTILFDVEERADFLLSQAERAQELGGTPAVILLVDQANPLFSRIRLPQKRWRRLIETASLLRRAGQNARALEVLEGIAPQISDDPSFSEEAARVAFELAELNQTDRALTLGQNLSKRIQKSSSPQRDAVLALLSRMFCVADEPQQALPLLNSIAKDSIKFQAFIDSAGAAKAAGSEGFSRRMLDGAESTLSRISDPEQNIALSMTLRDTFVDFGRLEDARRISLALQGADKKWRSRLQSYHAELIAKGFTRESLEVARSVTDAALRGLLLSETAKQLYKENNRNDAFRIVEEAVSDFDHVKDPNRLSALVSLVADSVLQINWPTYALKLLEKYKFDDAPVWLCRVASSFAVTGQREEAISVLQKALAAALNLRKPEDQAQVLLRIGDTLATLETVLDYDGQELLAQILSERQP